MAEQSCSSRVDTKFAFDAPATFRSNTAETNPHAMRGVYNSDTVINSCLYIPPYGKIQMWVFFTFFWCGQSNPP